MKCLQKNKRGDLTGIFYLVVTIAALAIVILIGGYIGDTVGTELKDEINSSNEHINKAFDTTINTSKQTLSVIWYVIFIGMLLSLLITSYFAKSHPIFVPVFIILLIIAIILGVGLSNAYEELYNVSDFSTISDTQTSVYFVMTNLPYTALVVGFIGLIITFTKPEEAATIM